MRGGPGEGWRLDWERGGDWAGSACIGDAGGCVAHRFKPVPYIGEKEIGALTLRLGLGQKGQGWAAVPLDQHLIFSSLYPDLLSLTTHGI